MEVEIAFDCLILVVLSLGGEVQVVGFGESCSNSYIEQWNKSRELAA